MGEQARIEARLVTAGVPEPIAGHLVGQCDPAMVEAWLNYARDNADIPDVGAFLLRVLADEIARAKATTAAADRLPTQTAEAANPFCTIHGVTMTRREKDGKAWYSHPVPGGTWCDGREGDLPIEDPHTTAAGRRRYTELAESQDPHVTQGWRYKEWDRGGGRERYREWAASR